MRYRYIFTVVLLLLAVTFVYRRKYVNPQLTVITRVARSSTRENWMEPSKTSPGQSRLARAVNKTVKGLPGNN